MNCHPRFAAIDIYDKNYFYNVDQIAWCSNMNIKKPSLIKRTSLSYDTKLLSISELIKSMPKNNIAHNYHNIEFVL